MYIYILICILHTIILLDAFKNWLLASTCHPSWSYINYFGISTPPLWNYLGVIPISGISTSPAHSILADNEQMGITSYISYLYSIVAKLFTRVRGCSWFLTKFRFVPALSPNL